MGKHGLQGCDKMANIEGNEILRRGGSYNTAVITTWQLVSQNIEGNYSTIRLRQYFIYGGSNGSVGSDYSSFGVLGTEFKTGSYRYYPGNTLLGSKDITVYHNTDGTFPQYSVGMWSHSFHFKPSQETWGNIGAGAVARIPRNATVTSATDFNDEQNPTIKYNNPGGFRINARLEFGGTNIRRDNISNTGSYTFNLTEAERKLLRQKCVTNSMTVRQVIATCIGGTNETGWSWLDKTMTIVNGNPTFSNFTFKDINSTTVALTGNNQNIVIGKSNIQATIPAASKAIPKKEAAMSKYRLSIDNKSTDINYSPSADVNGVINGATNGTISVFAVDSRNNSTEVKKLATKIINYTPLNKIKIDAFRTNGVSEDTKLILEGDINQINFGKTTNRIKYSQFRYKVAGSSTWSGYKPITLSVSNNKFTFNGLIIGDTSRGFNINNSYQIEVLVKDELSEVTFTDTLGSGIPTLALAKKGVGIMGKYDDNVGGALQIRGKNPFERNIMTIYHNSRYNISNQQLVHFTQNVKIGNNLTFRDNSIVIGKNIHHILVSATFSWWQSKIRGQLKIILRRRGKTEICGVWEENNERAGDTNSVQITPFLTTVVEGDMIDMVVFVNNEINVLADGRETFITVEVVD